MADKNPSEKRRYSFVGAFTLIGLGLGILLYILGYKSDVILAVLLIGIGIGLLIDNIIRIIKK